MHPLPESASEEITLEWNTHHIFGVVVSFLHTLHGVLSKMPSLFTDSHFPMSNKRSCSIGIIFPSFVGPIFNNKLPVLDMIKILYYKIIIIEKKIINLLLQKIINNSIKENNYWLLLMGE